ncbi:hypothetical protein KP509_02G024300 [Ceratopteris richardii]|uniref:Bifunctional inhibitor/plant lipid transfer protein/seed storage helical domain-containing protein n=1 Tax=Ceratopteris richardii TaxID=49495 RepID=A0A8T2VC15_CERRI|nr:hypothetical protein KP509_02G024300 [Ceratopteris richardii]
MGGVRRTMALVAVAMAALLLAAPSGEAAVTCTAVQWKLMPCVGFLTTTGGSPTAACCRGVRWLYGATKGSLKDRIAACSCIKSVSASIAGELNASNVDALPGLCDVHLSYSIGPSTDCSSERIMANIL